MSQSTNTSVISFCGVCDLSFETKKGLHRHQSYDLKHKELLEKMFGSDSDLDSDLVGAKTESKTIEKMYDSDEDFVYSKLPTKSKIESISKDNTKDIIKTKPATKPKTKTEEDMISTPELSMSVKNVMKNLGIKKR